MTLCRGRGSGATSYDRRVATIVVLNGTSSSGKTTIARAFQNRAPSLFLNFSIDSILETLPAAAIRHIVDGTPIPALPFSELVAAYYGCVRELAARGRDLVVDNAVTARYQAEHLVAALEGHAVLLVLVTAPEPLLRRRERARGDRRIGLAADQADKVERWLEYDLRIDTSVISAEAGADAIVRALEGEVGAAFARTRARIS